MCAVIKVDQLKTNAESYHKIEGSKCFYFTEFNLPDKYVILNSIGYFVITTSVCGNFTHCVYEIIMSDSLLQPFYYPFAVIRL